MAEIRKRMIDRYELLYYKEGLSTVITVARNNTTGNVGVNISAGNFNQQKNDMAAAVSETAYVASASVGAEQKLAGNTTNNYATLDYGSVNVNLNMTANGSYSGGGSGSYAGQSDQIGDLYPDTYSDGQHPNGGGSVGHILPVLVGEPEEAVALSRRLQKKGLLVPAIRPPSVPVGTARLRVSLTAAHTEEDVERLVSALLGG